MQIKVKLEEFKTVTGKASEKAVCTVHFYIMLSFKNAARFFDEAHLILSYGPHNQILHLGLWQRTNSVLYS
jgi:hypothetical protein